MKETVVVFYFMQLWWKRKVGEMCWNRFRHEGSGKLLRNLEQVSEEEEETIFSLVFSKSICS